MEFVWRPDFYHSGNRDQIFTHVIYDFDTSPFDLVFDSNPYQPPADDDEEEPSDEEPEDETPGNVPTDGNSTDTGNSTDSGSSDNTTNVDNTDNTTNTGNATEPQVPDSAPGLKQRKKLQQTTQVQINGLVEYVTEIATHYLTDHIILFVGAKENFEEADDVFYQLDNLITNFD